jgi:hypothetical protein
MTKWNLCVLQEKYFWLLHRCSTFLFHYLHMFFTCNIHRHAPRSRSRHKNDSPVLVPGTVCRTFFRAFLSLLKMYHIETKMTTGLVMSVSTKTMVLFLLHRGVLHCQPTKIVIFYPVFIVIGTH